MKKSFLSVATVCLLAATLPLSSCIGSFGLTNKLLSWNNSINNKFVNEVVFFAFWIVPVYEVSALADLFVLNSIEFWSGTSPVAKGKSLIEGNDGKYLVDCDGKGYTITNLTDGGKVRLNFNSAERSWSVVGESGQEYKLCTFIDDTHVKVPGYNGNEAIIELSSHGLMAYQTAMTTVK